MRIRIDEKATRFNIGDNLKFYKNNREINALVIEIKITIEEVVYYNLEWLNDGNFTNDWFCSRELLRLLEVYGKKKKVGFE